MGIAQVKLVKFAGLFTRGNKNHATNPNSSCSVL